MMFAAQNTTLCLTFNCDLSMSVFITELRVTTPIKREDNRFLYIILQYTFYITGNQLNGVSTSCLIKVGPSLNLT